MSTVKYDAVAVATEIELVSGGYKINSTTHGSGKISLASPKISWHNLNITSTSVISKIADNLSIDISSGSKKNYIVQNVSGEITGGLTGIFGPSGSGKTTFVNALARRLDPLRLSLSGETRINDQPYTSNDLKSFSGYVEQDDLLNAVFTVAETLRFHADLLLSGEQDYATRTTIIEDSIKLLGIDHCRDVIVGNSRKKGISGGERKRLAIAIELLKHPALLFLDEPTSGLDSSTALALIESLRSIVTARNVTIITTLHQPQTKIYQLLDRVVLISNTQILFNGERSSVLGAFEAFGFTCPDNYNPADYLIDVISDKSFDSAPFIANVNQQAEELVKTNTATFPAGFPKRIVTSWPVQLWILSQREALFKYREVDVFVIHVLATVAVALFIGLGVWKGLGNDQTAIEFMRAAMYFCVVFQGVVSCFLGSCNFPLERALMLRERHGGTFYVSAYFLAKTTVEAIYYLPVLLTFSLITYYLIGFVNDPRHFITYFVFIILTNNASIALANAISCVFISIELATVVTAFAFEITRLYGGWFISPILIATPQYEKWSFFLSTTYVSYGFFGAMINQFEDLEFTCTKTQLVKGKCPITNGNQVLANYGYNKPPLTITHCAGMLFVLIIGYRLIGYLGLRFIKF